MIPRNIHYVWLGGGAFKPLTRLCMNSWHRVLTDYTITEWNEESLDLPQLCAEHRFLTECIRLKLWAFASDWLRLHILYTKGGIYLDTDIEVLKTYDALLNNPMFIGMESNGYIGTGVIGAEAENPTIKRLLDFYDEEIWHVDFINNPIIFRYLREREPNAFEGCTILPQDVLSPYEPTREYRGLVENENTLSIHWYSNDWNMSRKGYVFMHTKHIANPLLRQLAAVRKSFGYKARSH